MTREEMRYKLNELRMMLNDGEHGEEQGILVEIISELDKGEWIPVSERLPERYKEVIVTDVETSDTYQSRYIGKGYWQCDNGPFKNRIIAWMPKPKPYKAEKGGEE